MAAQMIVPSTWMIEIPLKKESIEIKVHLLRYTEDGGVICVRETYPQWYPCLFSHPKISDDTELLVGSSI